MSAMTAEEQVIRDWLAGQLNPETGGPLPPSKRLSQPLPRRQVTAVVETLLTIIDDLRPIEASARTVMAEWDQLGPTGTASTLASHRALRAALEGPDR